MHRTRESLHAGDLRIAQNAFFWGADPDGDKGDLHRHAGEKKRTLRIRRRRWQSAADRRRCHTPGNRHRGRWDQRGRLARLLRLDQVLTGTQQNSEGDEAQAGEPNLYLYADEGGDHVHRHAGEPGQADITSLPPGRRSTSGQPRRHCTSPSRRARSLTGYDNTDAASGEPDAEVYLYDAEPAASAQLRCVSCNPSGARPSGRT